MKESLPVTITRYIRPYGKREFIVSFISQSLAPYYKEMLDNNCTLGVEDLNNGTLCVSLSNSSRDLFLEIVPKSGTIVPAVERLLKAQPWKVPNGTHN